MSAALLTARDVADALQVSTYTATNYMRSGALPAFRLNGSGPWRVKPEALEAWIAAQKAPMDPNRIEPRSPQSQAAQGRKKAS